MKEYKIGELFQYADRTLMCVSGGGNPACEICKVAESCNEKMACLDIERKDNLPVYFTNKLIFQADGIKLQIKRKGSKVKVKVLELSEDFEEIGDFIWRANYFTCINRHDIGVHAVGDKKKRTFDSDQEAIEWVDGAV